MCAVPIEIRYATRVDAGAVAGLAGELAQSFPFSRTTFDASYAALLDAGDACLLLAVDHDDTVGYVLGFRHLTFYANGPTASVEEILVRPEHRGRGIGRALMVAFERWAAGHDCAVVSLATRRATPFYLALGYEESATYLRKILKDPAKLRL
jgi:GNAT superfamily N-acetyltransferase